MTAPTEDLIERLEAVESSSYSTDNTTCWHRNPDGPEAAQAIRALQQEVERLREAVTELLYEDSDKSDMDRIVTRLKARSALTGSAQG